MLEAVVALDAGAWQIQICVPQVEITKLTQGYSAAPSDGITEKDLRHTGTMFWSERFRINRTQQSPTLPITSDGFEIDAETLGDGVVGKFRKLKALA